MKILVELEKVDPVTPEVIRNNVQKAIEYWRDNFCLSDMEDEGYIDTVTVTILS